MLSHSLAPSPDHILTTPQGQDPMRYSVLKADLKAHRDVIVGLWKSAYDEMSGDRYGWIYENSHLGPPTSFLLRHNLSGKLVGLVSIFPRNLFVGGRKVRSVICGDFIVLKGHRTLGPALFLQKEAMLEARRSGSELIYGFPNDKSEPILRRLGYDILERIVTMTKVLRSEYLLKDKIRLMFASRLLSEIIDTPMEIFSESVFERKLRKYSFEADASFDARIDRLWERISAQFSLIGERSASYLHWRFREVPHCSYRLFTMASPGTSEVLGYIVYSQGEARTQIVDFAYAGNLGVFDALFAGFSKYQRSRGTHSIAINVAGSPPLVHRFRRHGYHVRGSGRTILTFDPSDNPFPMDTVKSGCWYLTEGDSDV